MSRNEGQACRVKQQRAYTWPAGRAGEVRFAAVQIKLPIVPTLMAVTKGGSCGENKLRRAGFKVFMIKC